MLFKMGMIAPMSVIPTLLLMQKLHLSGTYLSAILLYTAINLPWAVFIYSNFMRALPRTLEEAAIIDGCGPFRLFMNIVFPLLKNVTVTNIVVIAMGVWNDFMIPIYFSPRPPNGRFLCQSTISTDCTSEIGTMYSRI